MYLFVIVITLTASICLVIGASRQGWRLMALAVLLTLLWPMVEAHAQLLLYALAPILDTLLVGALVLAGVSVFHHRRPRDPSDKRRVERD